MNTETLDNPYPGLRAFEYEENDLFFGREGKAQEIAERLARSHFIAVVGTSGSGKSSLVRAGLLPLLYGGMLPELGSHWRISIMRPGETPIHNLAHSLVYPTDFYEEKTGQPQKDVTQIGITEGTLRRSGVCLIDFIKNPANNFADNENLLVVVDQFEELFRFKEKSTFEDTEEAAAFVKLLIEATRDKQNRIFVVITMRSDFLGDCAEFRDLPEAINNGQYLIPRMTRDQLRQSIESPALVGDAKVSPALVNRLLNDLEEDQNQSTDIRERMLRDRLPVLQHAVMRTWKIWDEQKPRKESLDIEHYENEKIGGMAFALSNHADIAFAELDGRQKEIAEKMFKCLTATDSENRETRRPARIKEICAVAKAGEQEVFEVMEVFRQEGRTFLMPPPSVPLSAETMVDITHESLIRNWERLKIWVRQESDDAWQYRRLAEDACLYEEEYGESEEALWGGRVLEDAVRWREEFQPTLAWAERYQILNDAEKSGLAKLRKVSPLEEEKERQKILANRFAEAGTFLDKSAKKEAAEQAKEKLIQQERLDHEREKAEAAEQLAEVEREKADGLRNLTESLKRQRRYLVMASALSIILTVTSVIAAGWAWQSQNTAEIEKNKALDQQRKAEEQTIIAETAKKDAIVSATEAKQQEEEAKVQKVLAETAQQKAVEQRKEAEKQEQIADNKTKEAEEQRQIAEQQKTEALNQKEIAQKAKIKADEATQEAVDSFTILDREQKRIKLNLDGLFALEDYKYDEAKKNFDALIKAYKDETDEKEKVKYDWWANYNIAKTSLQQYKFTETEKSFNDALKVIKEYEKKNGKSVSSIQFPQGYFLFASYQPGTIEDTDVTNFKIITLRKFAQFYRLCAVTPEKCFENYTRKQAAMDDLGNDLSSAVKDEDTKDLNKKSVEQYDVLLEISKVKKPVSQNDKLYKADVQNELADVLEDLKEFKMAKKNYQAAIDFYETDKPLVGISVMKSLLDVTLKLTLEEEHNRTENLLEAEVLIKTIVDKTAELLIKENPEDEKNILYNNNIARVYYELALIYFDRYSYETYQPKIIKLKAQYPDDETFLRVLDEFPNLPSPTIFNSLKPEQQKIANELLDYSIAGRAIQDKWEALAALSPAIEEFINSENKTEENEFGIFTSLAAAYARNNEYCKARKIILKFEIESESSPVVKLREVADFYENSVQDSKKAAEYYEKWRLAFNEAFPNQSDFAKREKAAGFYANAGEFYLSCLSCPNHLEKARIMFTEYLKYLENNQMESTKTVEAVKNNLLVKQLALRILVGRTYTDEGKADEAKINYDEVLSKIQSWKQSNQNSLESQNSANISSNSANTNRAISNGMMPNANIPISNSNDSRQNFARDSMNKRILFYENYLRIILAELYFAKDEKKAMNLLTEYTQNAANQNLNLVSADAFILIKQQAFNLQKIGDLLKPKYNEQAVVYYQNAAETLDFYRKKANSYNEEEGYNFDYLNILKILKAAQVGIDKKLEEKINEAEYTVKLYKQIGMLRKNDCPIEQ